MLVDIDLAAFELNTSVCSDLSEGFMTFKPIDRTVVEGFTFCRFGALTTIDKVLSSSLMLLRLELCNFNHDSFGDLHANSDKKTSRMNAELIVLHLDWKSQKWQSQKLLRRFARSSEYWNWPESLDISTLFWFELDHLVQHTTDGLPLLDFSCSGSLLQYFATPFFPVWNLLSWLVFYELCSYSSDWMIIASIMRQTSQAASSFVVVNRDVFQRTPVYAIFAEEQELWNRRTLVFGNKNIFDSNSDLPYLNVHRALRQVHQSLDIKQVDTKSLNPDASLDLLHITLARYVQMTH